jgi:hypothetical protein
VEERAHYILIVAPIAKGARGGLEAVLEPIDRVVLVRLEVGEETHQEVGQLPDVVFVHPGQHREVSIGAFVHAPEVHLPNILCHCASSS